MSLLSFCQLDLLKYASTLKKNKKVRILKMKFQIEQIKPEYNEGIEAVIRS